MLAVVSMIISVGMSFYSAFGAEEKLARMSAALEGAKVARKNYKERVDERDVLKDKETALLSRVHSGNGLFDTIANLRRWTASFPQGDQIGLLEITTLMPEKVHEKMKKKDEQEMKDTGAGWLDEGILYLRVQVKARDVVRANTITVNYNEHLLRKGKKFFKGTTIRLMADRFKLADQERDKMAAVLKDPKNPGKKYELFVSLIELKLSQEVRKGKG